MTERRLVAALACRAGGSRLYGKPLQNLDVGMTILDLILHGAKAQKEIEAIVLGISEGVENQIFVDYAKRHGTGYIFGSQKDVLWRLIQCARSERATDVFRATTECPFLPWEYVAEAWDRHVQSGNDVTLVDHLPSGVVFEIYTAEALERSHRLGDERERSEYCSMYVRNHFHDFKVEILPPRAGEARYDLRLTVDHPEDLVLCRDLYRALKAKGPRIPIADIIAHIDAHPEMHKPVEQYHEPGPYWAPLVTL